MNPLYIVLGIVAVLACGLWTNARLEVQRQAYADYEECVETRAGMTVSAYYEKYGYAPECY